MSEVSVIVPVYRVEQYLRPCVDSVLAQTFTDFELILVDDGSPDNCGAICHGRWNKERKTDENMNTTLEVEKSKISNRKKIIVSMTS